MPLKRANETPTKAPEIELLLKGLEEIYLITDAGRARAYEISSNLFGSEPHGSPADVKEGGPPNGFFDLARRKLGEIAGAAQEIIDSLNRTQQRLGT